MKNITETFDIKSKIHTIRNKQVMLDRDLALLYGVETKVFNQAVKRNIKRFPDDFMFQLNSSENEILRSQFVTLRSDTKNNLWGTHSKYLPYAFTEQGVSMLSAILKSETAINISIKIIREFVQMRQIISNNQLVTQQLNNLEKRQITFEITAENKFNQIFKALESKDKIQQQGIFFNGQIFDAYKFIADLVRKAEKNIVLIDNYIDDSTLNLFSKNQHIDVTIYTQKITPQLSQDLEKYNQQYRPITLKTTKKFHDRFLIIDDKEIYHIGASLKDLGKKIFAFSLLKGIDVNFYKNMNAMF